MERIRLTRARSASRTALWICTSPRPRCSRGPSSSPQPDRNAVNRKLAVSQSTLTGRSPCRGIATRISRRKRPDENQQTRPPLYPTRAQPESCRPSSGRPDSLVRQGGGVRPWSMKGRNALKRTGPLVLLPSAGCEADRRSEEVILCGGGWGQGARWLAEKGTGCFLTFYAVACPQNSRTSANVTGKVACPLFLRSSLASAVVLLAGGLGRPYHRGRRREWVGVL